MNRVRWMRDPWSSFLDFGKIQDEMDRLLGAVERTVNLRSVPRGTFPTMNVYEDTETVVVTAEVPGVDASVLELSITDGVLTLKGERKAPDLTESHTVHRQERAYGQFVRSLSLPTPVDPDSCEATYENGILEVRMAKSKAALPRNITVKAGS